MYIGWKLQVYARINCQRSTAKDWWLLACRITIFLIRLPFKKKPSVNLKDISIKDSGKKPQAHFAFLLKSILTPAVQVIGSLMLTRLGKQFHDDRTEDESTLSHWHNPRHQCLQSQPVFLTGSRTSSVSDIRFIIFEDTRTRYCGDESRSRSGNPLPMAPLEIWIGYNFGATVRSIASSLVPRAERLQKRKRREIFHHQLNPNHS